MKKKSEWQFLFAKKNLNVAYLSKSTPTLSEHSPIVKIDPLLNISFNNHFQDRIQNLGRH